MKLKKVFIIIVSLLMILTTFPKKLISIAKDENAEIHNKEILEKVETLQNLAKEYIEENSITTNNATNLCMQYIRKDRYSGNIWDTLLGSVDTNFISYLKSKNNVPTFGNDVLIDSNTGKEIDFVHMIAALNAYLKNGDNVMYIVSTNYAGWAGDLITLLEEVTEYRVKNNIVDTEELQEYSNSLLGTNNPSTCSSSDMLADLDAISLYKDSNNNITKDLCNALYKYYINTNSVYNANNRLSSTQTILGGTKNLVKENARNLLTNTNLGMIDIKSSLFKDSSMATKVTSDDIEVVSQSFANYVYGEPYLKLQESNGKGIVGQANVEVKIIESNSNLKNENIEIGDTTIASATIKGEYLSIKSLEGGKTTITVYSDDKTVNSTYTLISENIAPSITKDLNESYNLTANVEEEISIEAEGTNNKYTWYIGDSKDGDFSEISSETGNTYKMVPTIDMNNKYIKCGIKNNGHAEIFSISAKLIVYEPENKEEENNSTENEEINNTVQEENKNVENDNETEENEEEKPTMLPYTGKEQTIILLAMSVFLGIAIVLYKKINKYKGI